MKKRTSSEKIKIDWPGTKKIRAHMAKRNYVKITINLDSKSLASLKAESDKTGIPYQRLLNSILKDSLNKRQETEDRLARLEKELAQVKRKLAA
jgi:hypothetical protein